MIEYCKEILKQLFPIGTIVENDGYKEGLFKELEKIWLVIQIMKFNKKFKNSCWQTTYSVIIY